VGIGIFLSHFAFSLPAEINPKRATRAVQNERAANLPAEPVQWPVLLLRVLSKH
jgi:hypothetical protein